MSAITERRDSPRIERDERVFIYVVSASEHPELQGTTVRCATVDVSATGIKIRLDQPVNEGCELELWVEISGHSPKFFLSGQAKWCNKTEDGHYQTGIELRRCDTDDLSVWQDLFGEEARSRLKPAIGHEADDQI